jgi:hypothetical protein
MSETYSFERKRLREGTQVEASSDQLEESSLQNSQSAPITLLSTNTNGDSATRTNFAAPIAIDIAAMQDRNRHIR